MTVELYLGDCLEVMRGMADKSVDTIITDPPYGLTFMGKDWDRGVPGVHFWEQALRVAKPGAFLLAFGGTRTYHRLVCAIEDAGWEIRDTIAWVYGSGFPKSYDISKGIDKFNKTGNASWNGTGDSSNGALGYSKLQHEQGYRPNDYSGKHQTKTEITDPEAQLWHGWGTALKPAFEPIVVAMKPVDGTFVNNALTWGVAGLNIDGGRVEGEYKWRASDSTIEGQIFKAGSFGDKPHRLGRFPANFIHDGSDEVVGLFPSPHGAGYARQGKDMERKGNIYFTEGVAVNNGMRFGDSGSAARFFYCAKAGRSERNAGLEGMKAKSAESITGRKSNTVGLTTNNRGDESGNPFCGVSMTPRQNHHPTVKPLALMRYLVRLTKTPTGGVVLDPFMGSGTTGIACVQEGREFVGIELNPEYLEIAERRIKEAQMQPRLETA